MYRLAVIQTPRKVSRRTLYLPSLEEIIDGEGLGLSHAEDLGDGLGLSHPPSPSSSPPRDEPPLPPPLDIGVGDAVVAVMGVFIPLPESP